MADSTKLVPASPALTKPDRQYSFVWQIPAGQPVLAIDLGDQTGWAVRWDEEHQACGRRPLALKKGETLGQTLFRFRGWIREFFSFAPFGLVIYRSTRDGQRKRPTTLQAQLEGVLLVELEAAQARERLVSYVAPTQDQLRRHGHEVHWREFLRRAKTEEELNALRLLSWFLELKGERPAS